MEEDSISSENGKMSKLKKLTSSFPVNKDGTEFQGCKEDGKEEYCLTEIVKLDSVPSTSEVIGLRKGSFDSLRRIEQGIAETPRDLQQTELENRHFGDEEVGEVQDQDEGIDNKKERIERQEEFIYNEKVNIEKPEKKNSSSESSSDEGLGGSYMMESRSLYLSSVHENDSLPPAMSEGYTLHSIPENLGQRKVPTLVSLFWIFGLASETIFMTMFLMMLNRFLRDLYFFSSKGLSWEAASMTVYICPLILLMMQCCVPYLQWTIPFLVLLALISFLLTAIGNIYVRIVFGMGHLFFMTIYGDLRTQSESSEVRKRFQNSFMMSILLATSVKLYHTQIVFWEAWYFALICSLLLVLAAIILILEPLVSHLDNNLKLKYLKSTSQISSSHRQPLLISTKDTFEKRGKGLLVVNVILSFFSSMFLGMGLAVLMCWILRFSINPGILCQWVGMNNPVVGVSIVLANFLGYVLTNFRICQTPLILMVFLSVNFIVFVLIQQSIIAFVFGLFFLSLLPSGIKFFLDEIYLYPKKSWSGSFGFCFFFIAIFKLSEIGVLVGPNLPVFGDVFFGSEWGLMIFQIIVFILSFVCVILNRIHYAFSTRIPTSLCLVYIFLVPHHKLRDSMRFLINPKKNQNQEQRPYYFLSDLVHQLFKVDIPNRSCIMLVLIILVFLSCPGVLIRIHQNSNRPIHESKIRIATWNIAQGFNFDGLNNLRDVVSSISKEDLHIIGLQESDGSRQTSNYIDIVTELSKRTGMIGYQGLKTRDATLGCAILSRLSYFDKYSQRLVRVNRKAFYQPMCSIRFRYKNSTILLVNVKVAAYNADRTAQAKEILRYIGNEPNVILIGDFNYRGHPDPAVSLIEAAGLKSAYRHVHGHDHDPGQTTHRQFFRGKVFPTSATFIFNPLHNNRLIAEYEVPE